MASLNVQLNGVTKESSEILNEKVKKSTEILQQTFKKYGQNEIFLSFNGGKDCTVLLHMVKSIIENLDNIDNDQLEYLYVKPENSFDEVEEFVLLCEKTYEIKINSVCGHIKGVLEQVCKKNSNLKVTLMGNRKTDPGCKNLMDFQETDPGWPKLMRVNPLLDWNCEDVWNYIYKNNVAYCSLYDKGYTSLGDKTNTIPNPNLKYIDSKSGETLYYPAYKLKNSDEFERAGRL